MRTGSHSITKPCSSTRDHATPPPPTSVLAEISIQCIGFLGAMPGETSSYKVSREGQRCRRWHPLISVPHSSQFVRLDDWLVQGDAILAKMVEEDARIYPGTHSVLRAANPSSVLLTFT